MGEQAARLAVARVLGDLTDGPLQLICGGVGDLLDHLTCQDVVTFTGSAATGRKLKSHPRVIEESVRFNLEADSLNYCILGPDAGPSCVYACPHDAAHRMSGKDLLEEVRLSRS